MNKIAAFVDHYENMPMGFGQWLSVALFIIFIRDGIESLVSTQNFAIPDAFHLLHVPVFFLSLLLFIIIILHFFTKTNIQKVSKIALIPFSIIILPVFLDFIVILLTKTEITYHYIEDNLWLSMLRFLDPSYQVPELPYTVRLEIALVTLMTLGYVFLKRRKILLALSAALVIYVLCFFYVSVPGVLIEIFKLIALVINVFHLQNFPFTEGVIDEGLVVIIELLLISLLALIWLWCYDSAKCKAILKNMRLTRSLHYMLLCLLGVFAYHLEALPIKDLFTFIRITGMLLAVFFAFQFSVVINDIFDIGCDKVSNIGRPLITQAINKDDYLNIGCVYLALGLLFSFWVSRTCTMITLLFIAFYFLYSAPPLRLKRFFPLSSFIIGIQATLAFAVGKLSFEENNAVAYYRNYLFWLVFIVFSLSSSVKDLKDIEGDKQTGVVTLPVLLGEENGRKLIAVLVFLSYCFVPYFLILAFHKTYAIVLSLGFGLINLFYIRKKSAKEKIIFFIYFIYAFLLILIVR